MALFFWLFGLAFVPRQDAAYPWHSLWDHSCVFALEYTHNNTVFQPLKYDIVYYPGVCGKVLM